MCKLSILLIGKSLTIIFDFEGISMILIVLNLQNLVKNPLTFLIKKNAVEIILYKSLAIFLKENYIFNYHLF